MATCSSNFRPTQTIHLNPAKDEYFLLFVATTMHPTVKVQHEIRIL